MIPREKDARARCTCGDPTCVAVVSVYAEDGNGIIVSDKPGASIMLFLDLAELEKLQAQVAKTIATLKESTQ